MRRNGKAIWVAGIFGLLIGFSAMVANAQNGRLLRQGLARNQNAQAKPLAAVQGLNLTQDQKDQIKAILANHKAEIRSITTENAQARKELAAALANGADAKTLKDAYDKVADAGWNAVQLRSQVGAEIKPLLTPEQLQLLANRKQLLGNLVQRLMQRRKQ